MGIAVGGDQGFQVFDHSGIACGRAGMQFGDGRIFLQFGELDLELFALRLHLVDAFKRALRCVAFGEGVDEARLLSLEVGDLLLQARAIAGVRAGQLPAAAAIGLHAQPDRLGAEQAGLCGRQDARLDLCGADIADPLAHAGALILAP
nr:hypothetical protein [Oceanicaulis sp. HTCC2633]